MFLLIFEDGSVRWALSVNDSDLSSADDGMMTVINANTVPPLEYFDGGWHEIEGI